MKKAIVSMSMILLLALSFGGDVKAASISDLVVDEATVEVIEANVLGGNDSSEIVPYSTVFNEASVSVFYDTTGMHISICTSMNGTASVVGVKDIEVQRKTWYGGWTTVATSTGGESYGVTTSVCTLTYTGTVEGESYRVIRTHYGNVDGYRELYAETSGFPCNIGYGG